MAQLGVYGMLKFEFNEDRMFFERLLCKEGEVLETYENFFDFRTPSIKKKEFELVKEGLLEEIKATGKSICQLSFHHICSEASGLTLDHFIPLSSNELNKHVRKMTPTGYKLVPQQSFGSNHKINLILVCQNCYHHRKHRFVRLYQEPKENENDN